MKILNKILYALFILSFISGVLFIIFKPDFLGFSEKPPEEIHQNYLRGVP